MKRKESCTGMRQICLRLPEQGAAHVPELPDFFPEHMLRHAEMLRKAGKAHELHSTAVDQFPGQCTFIRDKIPAANATDRRVTDGLFFMFRITHGF